MKPDDFLEPLHVIRRMSIPHCARGPRGCAKCKEAAKDVKIYLLEVYFDPGTMARPMIEVSAKGEKHLMVYDIINSFKDENEAQDYAKKNKLKLVEE